MARKQWLSVGELTLEGSSNGVVNVLIKDGNQNAVLCTGSAAAPNAVAGYAIGCLYMKTDGAMYQNKGTAASCTFAVVEAGATVGDLALAEGNVLVGNSGGVAAAVSAKTSGRILVGDGTTVNSVAVSGDATLASTGAVTIADGAVTNAKLASGAAVGALITAGLGASASYTKTASGAATLLASTVGARSVIIVVTVDQTFADGNTTQTTFQIGQTGTAAKFADTTAFTGATAGTVKTFAGTLTGSDNLIVTAVAAAGTGTGGITVTVLALPA